MIAETGRNIGYWDQDSEARMRKTILQQLRGEKPKAGPEKLPRPAALPDEVRMPAEESSLPGEWSGAEEVAETAEIIEPTAEELAAQITRHANAELDRKLERENVPPAMLRRQLETTLSTLQTTFQNLQKRQKKEGGMSVALAATFSRALDRYALLSAQLEALNRRFPKPEGVKTAVAGHAGTAETGGTARIGVKKEVASINQEQITADLLKNVQKQAEAKLKMIDRAEFEKMLLEQVEEIQELITEMEAEEENRQDAVIAEKKLELAKLNAQLEVVQQAA